MDHGEDKALFVSPLAVRGKGRQADHSPGNVINLAVYERKVFLFDFVGFRLIFIKFQVLGFVGCVKRSATQHL